MHQFRTKQVTVPAGTLAAAPLSVAWSLYPGWVEFFLIDIPRGHSGLTGVRLVYQQTPVIPFDLTAWLIGSGQRFNVPWQDEIMATGLVVQCYNTDRYPHTFYLWADNDPYLAAYKGQIIGGGPPAVPNPVTAATVGALSSTAA